jgi:hypothetical protein
MLQMKNAFTSDEEEGAKLLMALFYGMVYAWPPLNIVWIVSCQSLINAVAPLSLGVLGTVHS